MTPQKAPGLRELKKAKTRAAIQEHALRLFGEQGYAETTVDQIAAAAQVSPATFFRYFPTKEDTVLYDRLDPMLIEVFRAQPAGLSPTEALRATLRASFDVLAAEDWAVENARQQLVFGTPELRAKVMDELYASIDMLAMLAAERTGRAPDDFAVRAWAGAVVGVVMAAYPAPGHGDKVEENFELIDRGFALLAAGLPL
jgi:AcrR family transcriptional regulator